MIKSYLIKYILILFIIIAFGYSLKNSIIVNAQFFLSNIVIRESFLLENDINFKGIREPGQRRYVKLIQENYNLFKNLKFNQILNKINKLKKINIQDSEYIDEYKILSLLKNLSIMPRNQKYKSGIYISKDIIPYWNLSCDKYMSSFVSTAITNIVMIRGLIYDENSCYGIHEDYGFIRYKSYNKKPININLRKNELCQIAKMEKLEKIIEIIKDNNDYKIIYHKCNL